MLSVDEKSQIQALDRTQPGLPLKPGKRTVERYEAGRRGGAEDRAVVIPRTVELACAALAAGIVGYTAEG